MDLPGFKSSVRSPEEELAWQNNKALREKEDEAITDAVDEWLQRVEENRTGNAKKFTKEIRKAAGNFPLPDFETPDSQSQLFLLTQQSMAASYGSSTATYSAEAEADFDLQKFWFSVSEYCDKIFDSL
ncbi:hypothetical protein BMF89_00230 [Arthrobacter sp. SRS-W-1-2016]|uniref:hypothetical protein n=1 Tax=Arthrobacter sp. SRS-W-1-2016 TaxID=1930254 RepID=UPI0009913A4E|nr:hypothetical protein [Arthrobacter sp. SRS-W-1-2016]OOP65309.1 hypothetical protein BMF89_00230 [Arthrobacter sp. SRS-W-1-2016]